MLDPPASGGDKRGPLPATSPLALALALTATALFASTAALAQTRPPGGGGSGPTQTRPTRNKPVGPQRTGDDDDPQGPSPSARPGGEPTVQTPQDPLAIPEG